MKVETIFSFPDYTHSQEPHLRSALSGVFRKTTVDVGYGRMLSRLPSLGELSVFIDPHAYVPIEGLDVNKSCGRMVFVQSQVQDVSHLLHGAVDLVQIISPDPREAVEIVEACTDMVRTLGLMVVAFDINSALELRRFNSLSAREVVKTLSRSGFSASNADLEDALGVSPESEFLVEEGIVGRKR